MAKSIGESMNDNFKESAAIINKSCNLPEDHELGNTAAFGVTATGGFSGAFAGMTAGTALGPPGMVIGWMVGSAIGLITANGAANKIMKGGK
ncbi:MAG: hypothetical protein AAF572_27430 [Cyanobacteria bacterium P01_B01_bin.77]